jgi:hypothetical protein
MKKMKKLFEIDENEKRRILEMHENATKNLYLTEQPTAGVDTQQQDGVEIDGSRYKMNGITDKTTLDSFVNWGSGPGGAVSDKDMQNIEIYLKTGQGVLSHIESHAEKAATKVDAGDLGLKVSNAITEALRYGAQKYKSLRSVCAGPLSLSVFNGSNSVASIAETYPNIMDAINPIIKKQLKKIGQGC